VIVIDRQSKIELVNISAETLFCQSRRYLLGQPLANLIPIEAVGKCIEECLQSNAQYTLREVAISVAGAESLVDMTLSSITNVEGVEPSVVVELNVINRISRFMKEKNQLERQQAFRLMMRGLAHEIKNPLGGIRGAAQLLDRELSEPSQKELTDILIKEADRLTRLVDRVMGSRDQLKPQYLNIHEIEAQAGSAKTKLGFVTQFERFVTLNQEMHRQVLKIKIWDNGPGVPEEIKNSLFDPLITGRPEGTGLGLSITQEIVQRHKGVVQLEDHHGKTCFSIYLPYVNGDTETLPAS